MKKTYSKTYSKTIEKPRLEIYYDQSAENPRRESTNLGYFITVDARYNSPDRNYTLESIVKDTGETAEDLESHINAIRQRTADEMNEVVIAIYPVANFEHGNVVYKRGMAHGFDCSNNGFYIITDKKQKVMGVKKSDFERIIDNELEIYTAWVNGETYGVNLYDENGELQDGQSGYSSIQEVKDDLPEEFAELYKDEDLSEYLI